jgi:hypothetical protein
VTGRTHHLHEDRLFECYIAERSGERVDQPAADHLSDCHDCGVRYGELSRFMDRLRTEAEAETEEIFTPEALRIQQQHIARRIAHLGSPARVLSFPVRIVHRHLARHASRVAPRWAAAAAAAGVFVGVGAGIVLDSRARPRPAPMTIARPLHLEPQAVAVSNPGPVVDDDAFLSEIEAAIGGSQNQELLPFDALTPRVQEIGRRLP